MDQTLLHIFWYSNRNTWNCTNRHLTKGTCMVYSSSTLCVDWLPTGLLVSMETEVSIWNNKQQIYVRPIVRDHMIDKSFFQMYFLHFSLKSGLSYDLTMTGQQLPLWSHNIILARKHFENSLYIFILILKLFACQVKQLKFKIWKISLLPSKNFSVHLYLLWGYI